MNRLWSILCRSLQVEGGNGLYALQGWRRKPTNLRHTKEPRWSLVTCRNNSVRKKHNFTTLREQMSSDKRFLLLLFRISIKWRAQQIVNPSVYYLCKIKRRSWRRKDPKTCKTIPRDRKNKCFYAMSFATSVINRSFEWKDIIFNYRAGEHKLKPSSGWDLGYSRWWMCRLLKDCEVTFEIGDLTHD